MAEVDVNPIPENASIDADETAENEALLDFYEFHEDVAALQRAIDRFEDEYPGLLGVGLSF